MGWKPVLLLHVTSNGDNEAVVSKNDMIAGDEFPAFARFNPAVHRDKFLADHELGLAARAHESGKFEKPAQFDHFLPNPDRSLVFFFH